MMKEKDGDLTLFLEMQKLEKERNDLLLIHNSDELDPPSGSKPWSSPTFKILSSTPGCKPNANDFLNSDSEKNDYEWLLTPPGTPLFPSLEKELKGSPISHIGTPEAHPTLLKSRLANPADTKKSTMASRQLITSFCTNSTTRRPALSGGLNNCSRPPTPTLRPTVPAPSRPCKPSTPTSQPMLPSKPVTSRPRSSTPTTRSSVPTSRVPSVSAPTRPSSSRSATPKRLPSASSTFPATSASPVQSSSVTRSGPKTSKTSAPPPPPRGSSPTMRSRPWKPSEMPVFSLDAPQRPLSTSRPRRQPCSPLRERALNGNTHSGSSVLALNRRRANGGDTVSPVLIGSKMVERVVSSRRLVPPKQDDQLSNNNSLAGKSSPSLDSAGFGRTLSKKSLDMALRHMDIRRSIPNSLRPLMKNIPASSMYSVRSGPTRSKPVSVSDSPLATSSNASSEQSIGNSYMPYFDGSEIDVDINSEKGGRSSPVVGVGPFAR